MDWCINPSTIPGRLTFICSLKLVIHFITLDLTFDQIAIMSILEKIDHLELNHIDVYFQEN